MGANTATPFMGGGFKTAEPKMVEWAMVVGYRRRKIEVQPQSRQHPCQGITMERFNPSARLPRLLSQEGLLGAPSLFMIDVGVSGGPHPLWAAFSDARVIGIDPNAEEIARLTAQAGPNETYLVGFMGCPGFQQPFPPPASPLPEGVYACTPFLRSSALEANIQMGAEWACQIQQGTYRADWPETPLSLDQLVRNHLDRVDFVKIDTDGADYEVLLGGVGMLRQSRVLAVQVEAQLNGPVHPDANLFGTVDRFMRAQGFALFDMDIWRYSRAALPSAFLFDAPVQTAGGQVLWCDMLYLRDLGAPDSQEHGEWRQEDLLRLCAMFEAFGLPDCAAEVLITHGEGTGMIAKDLAVRLLDHLVPQVQGQTLSHAQFLDHWRQQVAQRRFRQCVG